MNASNTSTARVALVTGGASGIGETTAERLAQEGLTVVIGDRNTKGAEKVASRLRDAGFSVHALELDVSDPASIASVFEQVDARFGRCDVLVNNAGIGRGGLFLDFRLQDWQASLSVNLTGPFLCAQHAARLMSRHTYGRIVNIASIAGIKASVGRTAYGSAKAGLIALTRQMAIELAKLGITANAIAPGPVDTPLTQAAHSDKTREVYHRQIPMARYGTKEEIADAVVFLASPKSSYVTGQVLAVDGGFVAAGLLER